MFLLTLPAKLFASKPVPLPRQPMVTQQHNPSRCHAARGIPPGIPGDNGGSSVAVGGGIMRTEAAWAAATAFQAYETAVAERALPDKLQALRAECDARIAAYVGLVDRVKAGRI